MQWGGETAHTEMKQGERGKRNLNTRLRRQLTRVPLPPTTENVWVEGGGGS